MDRSPIDPNEKIMYKKKIWIIDLAKGATTRDSILWDPSLRKKKLYNKKQEKVDEYCSVLEL